VLSISFQENEPATVTEVLATAPANPAETARMLPSEVASSVISEACGIVGPMMNASVVKSRSL